MKVGYRRLCYPFVLQASKVSFSFREFVSCNSIKFPSRFGTLVFGRGRLVRWPPLIVEYSSLFRYQECISFGAVCRLLHEMAHADR